MAEIASLGLSIVPFWLLVERTEVESTIGRVFSLKRVNKYVLVTLTWPIPKVHPTLFTDSINDLRETLD